MPYAAATALTERSSSRTANAISTFARTVTRARGGTAGTDSVNHFRLQKHVGAQPFPLPPHDPRPVRADLDIAGPGAHPALRPRRPSPTLRAHTHPVGAGQNMDRAGPIVIDLHRIHDDTVESEQQ